MTSEAIKRMSNQQILNEMAYWQNELEARRLARASWQQRDDARARAMQAYFTRSINFILRTLEDYESALRARGAKRA